jgi:hypothetical protein
MYIEEQKAVHAARGSSGSDRIGNEIDGEMESLMGMTEAKEADELTPSEGINLPIVYNMHSNFTVMRHSTDQEISSIGIEKLI